MFGTMGKVSLFILLLVIIVAAIVLFTSKKNTERLNAGVTVSDLTINDSVGERELKGKVWQYGSEDSMVKGVILVSHGFSGHAGSLQRYSAELARSGYVVAALDHEDIKGLRTAQIQNDPMVARARQLNLLSSFVMSEIIGETDTPPPIGLLGFSLGAYASLVAAGLPVDLGLQAEACATLDPNSQNIILCNPRMTQRLENLHSNESVNLIDSPMLISSIALLAPAYLELIDVEQLSKSKSTVPALFVAVGRRDEFVRVDTVEKFASSVNMESAVNIVDQAGHYFFLEQCLPFLRLVTEICRDPIPIDRLILQAQVTQQLVSFFDQTLVVPPS